MNILTDFFPVQCTGIFAGNKPNNMTTVGVDEPHLSDKNG
jgi:hypothetical protein